MFAVCHSSRRQPAENAAGCPCRVKGRRQGEGRLKFANGDVFVGTFSGTERQGYGVYYYISKGCKLEGEWVCTHVQLVPPAAFPPQRPAAVFGRSVPRRSGRNGAPPRAAKESGMTE